jgi:hypothetical protein
LITKKPAQKLDSITAPTGTETLKGVKKTVYEQVQNVHKGTEIIKKFYVLLSSGESKNG